MAIDKQRIEEFEQRHKETIFNSIDSLRKEQFETINQISTNLKHLGESENNISNTSITLNNKLIELSHRFKKAGISMFSKEVEDEEYNFVSSSMLGDAIIHDLIDKLEESIKKLEEYGKTIEDISKQRNEQILSLQNVSPIKKFFSRLRALFVPIQPIIYH